MKDKNIMKVDLPTRIKISLNQLDPDVEQLFICKKRNMLMFKTEGVYSLDGLPVFQISFKNHYNNSEGNDIPIEDKDFYHLIIFFDKAKGIQSGFVQNNNNEIELIESGDLFVKVIDRVV